MVSENPRQPVKGDEYRYPDGTIEVVFAVEDGSVLTVKNYRDIESFRTRTTDATYVGTNQEVENIPDIDEFRTE